MSTDGSEQIPTARIRPEHWGDDSKVSDETVEKPGLLLVPYQSCLPPRPTVRPLRQPAYHESNTREESLMGPKLDLVLTTFPDFFL